jgi:hypothetical protein
MAMVNSSLHRVIEVATPLRARGAVQAIYRGDIQPLAFDYQRAKLAA